MSAAESAGDEVDGFRMTLLDHLSELRVRVIRAAAAVILSFCIALPFGDTVFRWMTSPAAPYFPEGASFIFTRPAEKFMVDLRLALFAAIFLSLPVVAFQAWRFVAPGLYKHERAMVVPFVFFFTAFFLGGASFCYFLVLPWTMQFFLDMGTEQLKPMINISDYLGFATTMLLSFGVTFELPLVMFFLGRLGLVQAEFLRKYRRHAIVLLFVVAAVLTPPDWISQVAMGVPLYLLYELSILLVAFWGRPPLGSSDNKQV